MTRLAVALAISCLIFLACLANTTRTKADAPQRVEQPVVPLCADPFAQYTGILFEDCNRVNRYWKA